MFEFAEEEMVSSESLEEEVIRLRQENQSLRKQLHDLCLDFDQAMLFGIDQVNRPIK